MKTLFYYVSPHGSTRQYAEWLHEKTNSDVCSVKEPLPHDLSTYDTIVMLAPIYVSKLKGASKLAALWEKARDKRIMLVTVSGAEVDSPEIEGWLQASLPAEMLANVEKMGLRGVMRRSGIPLVGPLLKLITGQDPIMAGYDELSPKAIEPILEALSQ